MAGSLEEFDVPKEINGWTLATSKPYELIWASPSDYGLKVKQKGIVRGLLPPMEIDASEGQPSLQVIREIHPGTGDTS